MIKLKRVKTALAVILALFMCVGFLGACGEEQDRKQKTAVTYDPNGGTYRSCVLPFKHYYEVNEGETRVIYSPKTLSNQEIMRSGYTFEGWFPGEKVDGEINFAQNAWNFETDKITSDGITLYAKWKKIGTYTYTICYVDETSGEEVALGSYAVSEGETFIGDYNNFASKRSGYTAIPGFYDENGNVWDENYQMEGSPDGKRDVKIFVKHVKGSFAMCGTVSQFNAAVRDKKNIYLLADIDLGGKPFSGFDNNGIYTKKLYGNGHTIKNFVLETYYVSKDADIDNRDSYRMGLFGNAKGAQIENVSFTGVKFIVDAGKSTIKTVVVSPICVKAENSTFKNITFEGVYEIKKLPSGITEESENFIIVNGGNAYYKGTGEASVTENVNCTFVKKTAND